MDVGIGHGGNPGNVRQLICPCLRCDEREPRGVLIAMAGPRSVGSGDLVQGADERLSYKRSAGK